jgi:hypothetical protein
VDQELTEHQLNIVRQPLTSRIFMRGAAGAGKTTTASARLKFILSQGISGDSILLLIPHRNLASPYLAALHDDPKLAGNQINALTIGGLARRMVDLFWPQISSDSGFHHPQDAPVFLTLETTQYFVAKLVRPLLEEGFFNSITIDRNRLFSQIVDNLNKAAVVGFPHTQINERLKAAWNGDPVMLRIYDDAQYCASLFRDYCLQHNFLDFSLQIETFVKHIWPLPLCQDYLLGKYRHLIVDNIEEDTSVTHDLLFEWLDACASALVVLDEDAGFRRFLGANPSTALLLQNHCDLKVQFTESFVMSPQISTLSGLLGSKIDKARKPMTNLELHNIEGLAVEFSSHRFFPGMLDWVCERVISLVRHQHCPPGEIVILSPYLSDALRFALLSRLDAENIPVRSHRPSRALRDEPVTQCLLTLAQLAHPEWYAVSPDLAPNRFDVASALMQAINELDPTRAQILTSIVFREKEQTPWLSSFSEIRAEMQERITYRLGEKYETLREWIHSYLENPAIELDYFISRIFGEVLSQPGFGFHANFLAGEITANLIESIQKFRWVADSSLVKGKPLGAEYIEMIQDGVIASQYLRSWESWSEDAVLVAPAYTFLMYNQAVDYQIWLDPGSRGWSERLYQPLTQPYVLSRNWEPERVWNDLDEVDIGEESLYKLATGLLHRCRKKIFLGLSDINEQGYEQRGPLLHAFQKVFQDLV